MSNQPLSNAATTESQTTKKKDRTMATTAKPISVTAANIDQIVIESFSITCPVETKRSRKKDKEGKYIETEQQYAAVKPVQQEVTFVFQDIPLRELLESNKGLLKAMKILYQDGVRRREDAMEWLQATPKTRVDVAELLETKRRGGAGGYSAAKATVIRDLIEYGLSDTAIMEIGLRHGIPEDRLKRIIAARNAR